MVKFWISWQTYSGLARIDPEVKTLNVTCACSGIWLW